MTPKKKPVKKSKKTPKLWALCQYKRFDGYGMSWCIYQRHNCDTCSYYKAS